MRSRILDEGARSSIRNRQVKASINNWYWGGGGGGGNTPVAFGILYTQPSWPDFASWTVTGFTPTVSGGELTVIGAGSTARYMTNNYGHTNLSNFTREVIFRPQTTSGGGDILACGIYGTGGFGNKGCFFHLVVGGGALNGKVRVGTVSNDVYTNLVQAAGTLTYNLNDRIKYTLNRTNYTYTFTVENLHPSRLNSVQLVRVVDPQVATTLLNGVGKFCTWAFSGTHIIESDTATTTDFKYSSTAFIGDSKTEGFSPTIYANAYANLLFAASSKKHVILAKGNNIFSDLVNGLPEIIAFAPTYVVINCGSNDIRAAVPTGTWQAAYLSLRNQLVSAGIIPIHILPMPEVVNVTAVKNYINATFASDIIIDCNTAFNAGTMLIGDNIHPNDLGNVFIKDQILAGAPQII